MNGLEGELIVMLGDGENKGAAEVLNECIENNNKKYNKPTNNFLPEKLPMSTSDI